MKWDLVAPDEPSRTYTPWPTRADGHPGIFGDPFSASAESGELFLDAIVNGLAHLLEAIDRSGGTYSARSLDHGGSSF